MFGFDPMMTAEDRRQIAAHLAGQVVETTGEAYDDEYADDDNEDGEK